MSNFTEYPDEEDDYQDGFASVGGQERVPGSVRKGAFWKNCFGRSSGRQSWTYHRIRMTPPPYVDDRRDGGGGACRTCINITKWMPVLFISAVISWSYYAFVVQLCILTMRHLWAQILSLAVYHVALVLFLWSYWQTVFTSSSRVPRKFRIPSSIMERIEGSRNETEVTGILEELVRSQQLPVQTRAHITQIRYCEKCHIIKPDRAHHCSVCGYCVLKMDHHCPWVNNCVCFDNYKFFILFLAYAFLYCVVIFLISFPYFIDIWRGGWDTPMSGRFHILFVFFVAAMFAISLCSLLGYHCYLVTRNRSTLESFRSPVFRHGPDKKGFNLGSYNNFAEVFGEDKTKWFLPVFTSLGDGISFPTRHNWGSLNANYNSLDTADSTPVSGRSPDHCVEVKVEARTEPNANIDSHALNNINHTAITMSTGGGAERADAVDITNSGGGGGGNSNGNNNGNAGVGSGSGGGRNGTMTSPHKETPLVYF